ncbi:MAG: TadE/TadG family type IV pilus assembly protein [Bacillota bacterium]|nr:TadE/TadG family type IV pilus assembly protein [Bacillota bacterium]
MKRFFKKENGQAIVELAITLPILLSLLCGILDFGWIYSNKLIISNCSREGARTAMFTNDSNIQAIVCSKVKESAPTFLRDKLTVSVTYDSDGDTNVTVSSPIQVLTPISGIFLGGQILTLSSSTVMAAG